MSLRKGILRIAVLLQGLVAFHLAGARIRLHGGYDSASEERAGPSPVQVDTAASG